MFGRTFFHRNCLQPEATHSKIRIKQSHTAATLLAPPATSVMDGPLQQQQEEQSTQPAGATFIKRGNRSRGNLRKRPNDDVQTEGGEPSTEAEGLQGPGQTAADDGDDPTRVERRSKVARAGDPLSFGTKGKSDEPVAVTYEGNRALPTGRDESVFKVLETETQTDRDARALREAVLQQGKEGQQVNDGKYRGMNSYIDYRRGFRREHTVAAEKGTGAHGPLRANMYVRMTALMDYNPCICKDYKETGFCSYGDSCKFMHDRGDYKQSWELDRDWEEEQKRKLDEKMKAMERGGDSDEEGEAVAQEEEEEEDDLPFACYICRKPWGEAKNPVVTRCKHYFCESCALKNNAKSSKCAVCEQPTQGIFNVAHDINKKLKKMGKAA